MSGVLRLCESEMTDGQDNERDPLQPDVDQTLVDQAIEELPYRTAAYERLMQKYQRMIFGVCYRMLNNRADAEDICQDVMVKVFGTLQKFEGRSSFKTWLMKITSNTCLTHITKNKRRREIRTEWAEDPARDGTTMIDTSDHDVSALLSTIKPKEREVLTLRYLGDLSLQEIAEVCDISLSAAKMRLYRATEALNAQVKKHD